MLPMGTIMTAAMFLGAVALGPLFFLRQKTGHLFNAVAILVIAAGAWNVFWYWLRHLTEFWGVMALGSGLIMILCGYLLSDKSGNPKPLARWVTAMLLVAFGLRYALTIASL
ncbi:MAG: hypothetical protein AAF402_09730 [Pseudomonadota bacterium]